MSTEAPEAPAVTEGYENYWGTDETHRHYLPDEKQFFEFKIMNEGAKARFQRMTNQDLTIKQGGEAKVRMDPANERHTLIKESVTGWLLYMPDKENQMVQASFTPAMLDNWLNMAPPKIVEDLELAIRKANPWMQADMKSEQIREEIKRLEDLLREKLAEEAGESVSANK
jgi:hypothetical protein